MQPTFHSWRENSATARCDESLIAAAEAKRIAGSISDMTLWRWAKAGVIPKPMQIRGRNYWRRSEFMRALELAAEDQAPAAD